MILLNRNEAPFDLPKKLKEEISDILIKQEWNRYPSMFGTELKENIAKHCNLPVEQVFIGTGSSGLIQVLISIYQNRCKRIVFPNPSFELFNLCGNIYELEKVSWNVNSKMQYDYDNFPGKDGSIYIMCHPNNPTGDLLDPNFLEAQIKKEPNSVFIIDEAYIEFSGKTLSHLIHLYENVIVVHTLSKAIGLAGVRLGWGVCHKNTAKFLSQNEVPYRLNHFNMIIGNYIFKNYHKHVNPIVKQIVSERESLFKKLSFLFLDTTNKVYPSEANYLLIETDIEHFIEEMEARNIRLARVKNYPTHYRITVGTKEQNDCLVNEITQLMNIIMSEIQKAV